MSLKISGLTKKFGEQIALNDININIANNEIIGLLGPNGAGKSTLMKSITGVLKIDEGEILLDEKNISENEIESKKKIGFLPENNPLYNEMYVKEYLQFVANLHNIKKERVEQVIDLVGITPEKSKKIGQLSKGYKQRVGLAQAILHEPDLLILDEPTNGLDPNQIVEIRNVIKEIGKAKTVILSTHIMQEVEALCSRVILIHQGKILQDSPISEFKGKFASLEEAFQSYTGSEKSSNNLVFDLYSFILKNEERDSDFWTQGDGFEDIHRILFDFDENDWNDLSNDLKNWTSFQIELFCNGLLCVDYYERNYNEEEIENLENRFSIISTLLKIGEAEGEISNNIEDFIKVYFPKINSENTKVVSSIKDLKKWNDNRHWINGETGEKIKSPFTETIENAYMKISK